MSRHPRVLPHGLKCHFDCDEDLDMDFACRDCMTAEILTLRARLEKAEKRLNDVWHRVGLDSRQDLEKGIWETMCRLRGEE